MAERRTVSVIAGIPGWISIRDFDESTDRADEHNEREKERLAEAILDKIDALDFHSADVRVINSHGEKFVSICVFRLVAIVWQIRKGAKRMVRFAPFG